MKQRKQNARAARDRLAAFGRAFDPPPSSTICDFVCLKEAACGMWRVVFKIGRRVVEPFPPQTRDDAVRSAWMVRRSLASWLGKVYLARLMDGLMPPAPAKKGKVKP